MMIVDWSKTEIGEPSAWPPPLRSIVALIMASGKPMFVVWGAARTLIYNDAYAQLLGAKHPRALGAPYFSVFPDAAVHAAPLFDRLFGGTAVELEDISISFVRDDAALESTFALSYTPIRDHDNRVVGVLCIHAGGSAQPQGVSRWAQVLELTPSVIAILQGSDHRVELANAGFERLADRSDLAGRRFMDVAPDGVTQACRTALDRAFAEGHRGEVKAVRWLDRRVDFVFQPITDGIGEITGVFVHGTDVTERSQLEAQLQQSQKMEAVGQMTGGLAHDFNNLLAGIASALEVLKTQRRQGRYDEMDRYIEAAQSAAQRAGALTHRLLAFARRQPLEPHPIDLNALVSDMSDLIRRTVGRGITLSIETANEAPAGVNRVLADPSQLENALLNLCLNARDAMPQGGRLSIGTGMRVFDAAAARAAGIAPGDYLWLRVTDTGSGMSPEVRARAFEPFFTTKPPGSGTGLGLAMIDRWVRESGGRALLDSTPGVGTRVLLLLPRYAGEPEALDPAPGDLLAGKPVAGNPSPAAPEQ